MRSGYNDSVERHNTRIGQIPDLFGQTVQV